MVKKFLPGYPETMGHSGESNRLCLASLSATFNLYYDAKVMLSSFSRFFCLNYFRQVKVEVPLESCVSEKKKKKKQLKIISIPQGIL